MNIPSQVLNPSEWVKNYADYLYRYALSRVNDADTAKDLVQDTFLAALEKVESFEGRSTERTWLTAIIRFKIIDVYRKKSGGLKVVSEEEHIETEQQEFFDEGGHWVPKHYPAPFGAAEDDLYQAKEFTDVLQKCLQKLPELWKSVFTMKHLDEDETSLICESLNITQSNYWVIIHRAKLNLRSCLQKNWA